MSSTAGTAQAAEARSAKRRSIGLGEAATEFWRWPSPWIMAAVFVPALTARLSMGGWRTADLITVGAMIVAQPFVEWSAHITLLHMRPLDVKGRVFDPLFARKHREHHADPRDTELVFIPVAVLLQLVAIAIAVAFLAFSTTRLGLTFLAMISAIGLVYEWTHYLIHTDYRPQTALYRRLWRNHRLHHYKNENYWYSLTNTTPDRLLGTDPDPSEVETSPTATNLLGT